ncbi:DIS3 mitotic control homolog [Seminavis robusta]|uniref:DIS3 mitotic control homolog n=1 Tax=Seminavis robusta TaxID=568900 RepID=A0A9N8HH92_9STRA|nr:DIS3 mitotic control homolog [Seminavis robusta]|eukprot:Sro622_g177050.1 DIS3 mitotic control homolog (S (184) ;mRNA; f:47747-48298
MMPMIHHLRRATTSTRLGLQDVVAGRSAAIRHVSTRKTADTMKYIYVHPLSQLVLECLQNDYSDWLVQKQLHANTLRLHRDGTFEIKFPKDKHTVTPNKNDESAVRIWTSFDNDSKQHWLSVSLQHGSKLQGRYMLQDNLSSGWTGNNKRRSLPERIQTAVEEMVEAIDDTERKQKQAGLRRN